MPKPTINLIQDGLTQEEMVNQINMHFKEIDWLLSRLDTKNIFEVAGWRVSKNQLASKDGDVGFSTEDTGADDTRIWAGDAKDANPNFKVTKSGLMTAISALLLSVAGYPRFELNSADNLMKAAVSATNFISIVPDVAGNPQIKFDNGTVQAFLGILGANMVLQASAGNMQLSSSVGDVLVSAPFGFVKFDDWSSIFSQGDAQTLQAALDNKATKSSYTGSFDIVTDVDFTNQVAFRSTVNVRDGVITSVN